MRIIAGYQNTKYNGDDLELTPYVFLVNPNTKIVKVYGIGICWLHQAVYVGLAFNLPNNFKKRLFNHTNK